MKAEVNKGRPGKGMEVAAGCVANRQGDCGLQCLVRLPWEGDSPESYEFRVRAWGGGSWEVSGMSKAGILKGCRSCGQVWHQVVGRGAETGC